jgi:proteasome assembly chaperone 3
MSSEFPITNKQACIEHQGQKTEVLVTGFQDKIFVVITQYGKIGSLVNQNKTIQ